MKLNQKHEHIYQFIKENLSAIFIILFFVSLKLVDKYQLDPLSKIFLVLVSLIALIGGFLAVIVIRDFTKRFETYKKNKIEEIELKINDSIKEEKETNLKELEKRLKICKNRIELYEEFSKIYSLKSVSLVIVAFIFLILGILLYIFVPEMYNGKTSLILIIFFIVIYLTFRLLFIIYDTYNH